jgi:hypothetical protein
MIGNNKDNNNIVDDDDDDDDIHSYFALFLYANYTINVPPINEPKRLEKLVSIFKSSKKEVISFSALDLFWQHCNSYQSIKWKGLHITLSDFAGKNDNKLFQVKHRASLDKAVIPEIRSSLYGNTIESDLKEYIFEPKNLEGLKWLRFPNGIIAIDFSFNSTTLDKICTVIERNGVYGVKKGDELKIGNKKDGFQHRLHGLRKELHMSLGNIEDIEFIRRLINLDINPVTQLPLLGTPSLVPQVIKDSIQKMKFEIAIVSWNITLPKAVHKIVLKEKLMKINK